MGALHVVNPVGSWESAQGWVWVSLQTRFEFSKVAVIELAEQVSRRQIASSRKRSKGRSPYFMWRQLSGRTLMRGDC